MVNRCGEPLIRVTIATKPTLQVRAEDKIMHNNAHIWN